MGAAQGLLQKQAAEVVVVDGGRAVGLVRLIVAIVLVMVVAVVVFMVEVEGLRVTGGMVGGGARQCSKSAAVHPLPQHPGL